jgi:long-chain acyl-CoA synthetase
MGTIWIGQESLEAEALRDRASRVSNGLSSLGIQAGDCVAFCLRNDIAFFEASLGATGIGAFPVAVNWHYTLEEAHYLLTDCGAKVLIIHADLLERLREAIPAGVTVLSVPVRPSVARPYGLDPVVSHVQPDDLNWDLWLESFGPYEGPPAQAPSTIIYTSGTTGRPKGVRRSASTPEQAERSLNMLKQSYGFTDWADRMDLVTTAIVGPIYHSAPNAHANVSLSLGANIVILPRFDPEDLLRQIQTHRITHLNMAPIMFNRLIKLPQSVRDSYDLSSLIFVAHAAAPVSPPVKREMLEWWGPVINEYYGSTEMGNVTFCTAEEWLAHPGTVGRVMPNARVRVIDADGQDCPIGTPGEVLGRNLGFADFTYHGDDEKRRRAEKFGLIAPGDIGYFDADGFLYLCDRASDMVISGGVNIYPAEIEAVLLKMPGVADCAIFGIPDDEFGETLCAVVQPQAGEAMTELDVKAYLRDRVAGFKVPRRVEFNPELPREDSGKIFKRKLREPYWAGAGRNI